jgi:hypothetical protein
MKKNTLNKICSRYVMDETAREITFDEILSETPKSYKDFQNNEKLWERFNGVIKIARKFITRVG